MCKRLVIIDINLLDSMNLKTIVAINILVGLSLAHARTWTSVDGSKTFQGDLKSYDPDTGKVTVILNGRQTIFTQDKLSEEDRDFLRQWKEEADKPSLEDLLKAQKVGSQLTPKVLTRLDGKKLKKASMVKAPEYYLLYFSASW